MTGSSAFAETVYSCYSGKISFDGLNFNEIHLEFSDHESDPYTVIFADGERAAGTDMFCSEGIVGVCGLTDASGRLSMKAFDADKVEFSFEGAPSIVERPDGDWPFVDPQAPDPGIGIVTLLRDNNLTNCEYTP
jgi:hypothetical protein